MYDFANILFSGPCNARCPFCIGKQVDRRLNVNNLGLYPLHNLERFVKLLRRYDVRQVVFTGSNTDPLLYRHLGRLLEALRQKLHPQTQFSLHTNGLLALRKSALIDQFERVSLSFPSFIPQTYQKMMGVAPPPDVALILCKTQPPVKISCLVNNQNRLEMEDFLRRCHATGVRRLALRKLVGEQRPWPTLLDLEGLGLVLIGEYRSNPIYDYIGLEVTLWDFAHTASASLNLFSSGYISDRYLLTEAAAPFES